MQNIRQKEDPETLHAVEKGNHEFQESLGQRSSSKQDAPKFCCLIDSSAEQRGNLNGWLLDAKSGQPLAFYFKPKSRSRSRDANSNPQAQMDVDCRSSMKQFTSSGEGKIAKRAAPPATGSTSLLLSPLKQDTWKKKETIGRVASWLATFTFSLCLFSIIRSHPLLQSQKHHSLVLAIVAVSNFTVFLCAASVMTVVGARFTLMQKIMLLISAMAPLFA